MKKVYITSVQDDGQFWHYKSV